FFRFDFMTPPTPEIYTLSLHDALPISALPGGRAWDSCSSKCWCSCSFWPSGTCTSGSAGRWNGIEPGGCAAVKRVIETKEVQGRSEEHTSELQSRGHLVCRLLLEKKKY